MMDFSFLFNVVNGGYSEWSVWTQCTKSCGGGNQIRTRNCTSPIPIDGGLDCSDLGVGGDEESKQCNALVCPGQKGNLLSFPFSFPLSLLSSIHPLPSSSFLNNLNIFFQLTVVTVIGALGRSVRQLVEVVHGYEDEAAVTLDQPTMEKLALINN